MSSGTRIELSSHESRVAFLKEKTAATIARQGHDQARIPKRCRCIIRLRSSPPVQVWTNSPICEPNLGLFRRSTGFSWALYTLLG